MIDKFFKKKNSLISFGVYLYTVKIVWISLHNNDFVTIFFSEKREPRIYPSLHDIQTVMLCVLSMRLYWIFVEKKYK